MNLRSDMFTYFLVFVASASAILVAVKEVFTYDVLMNIQATAPYTQIIYGAAGAAALVLLYKMVRGV